MLNGRAHEHLTYRLMPHPKPVIRQGVRTLIRPRPSEAAGSAGLPEVLGVAELRGQSEDFAQSPREESGDGVVGQPLNTSPQSEELPGVPPSMLPSHHRTANVGVSWAPVIATGFPRSIFSRNFRVTANNNSGRR